MKNKTLTTRFLDFSGGEQNHILGELSMRMVAHPNKNGDKFWVKEHIANNGLYPASSFSDLLPNSLRQVMYARKYTTDFNEAVNRLKRFDALVEDPEFEGQIVEGKILAPQDDIYINSDNFNPQP